MHSKRALITGITGQDGAYLASFLLRKGYEVHGLKRRSSSFNCERISHFESPHATSKFFLHYGDLTDSTNILRIMQKIQPDEIYNLAAQSHVQVSFETPEYTANADAVGALRILEAIRILGLCKKTKYYQASTSELYGNSSSFPQNESTPFSPRSPYAAAKLYAYWITVNYRQAYNIFACNGILFNHESPLRSEDFVTRKITLAAAKISLGLEDRLSLGNLASSRDWGHAHDYVEGMWKMLQHEVADDFVLATGQTSTVRDFVTMAFQFAGIDLEFQGEGLNEVGICKKTKKILVKVDPKYFRPTEVDLLVGDASKAFKTLGWAPKKGVHELCKEMVTADIFRCEQEIRQKREIFIPDELKNLAPEPLPSFRNSVSNESERIYEHN